MNSFFVYAITGKLIIYFIQTFPLSSLPLVGGLFGEGKFLNKWWTCDLCLGFWVYTFLSFPFDINLLQEWFYIPVLNEIIMGMAVSFLVHLISIGWKEKFSIMNVEWSDADNR